MAENPLDVIRDLDSGLLKSMEETRTLAMSDGAMPRKTKYLIAMALDASHGAVDGVANLARAAKKAGASNEEIAETLRVAYFISGAGVVYTAARALKDVL